MIRSARSAARAAARAIHATSLSATGNRKRKRLSTSSRSRTTRKNVAKVAKKAKQTETTKSKAATAKSSCRVVGKNKRKTGVAAAKLSTAAAKKSQKNTPKKKPKTYPGLTPLDYVPNKPPKSDWLETYNLVEELRKDRTAPVDTFGSEALPQRPPEVPHEVFRFQALVALMLSSQTKDPVVGAAIKRLQSGLKPGGLSLEGVLAASEEEIRQLIYGVGFYNNKAKYIKRSAEMISSSFEGIVPGDYASLVSLPGVGPKMALIILDVAFDRCLGVSIDTHLHRMLGQLGWTKNAKNPDDTRRQLEAWLPREYWKGMNLVWVGMGQELREERPKLLEKAVNCSDPKAAVKLLRKFGIDVKKEAEKSGIVLP